MLDKGVNKKSHSDWSNPVVLVPTTDGSVHFCVDYRKVNTVSKFDTYPHIEELLNRLGAASMYLKPDLIKVYW